MVNSSSFLGGHAITHVKPVEEDGGCSKGHLRELEEDAGLDYEVHAFGAADTLIGRSDAIMNRGRVLNLVLGEEPLARQVAFFNRHGDEWVVLSRTA